MTRTTWLWTCEECGEEFATNKQQPRRFCSGSCRSRATARKMQQLGIEWRTGVFSEEACRKRAITNQRNARLNAAESRVYDWLKTYNGLHVIPQLAVDKYNVDFALPQVGLALELDGNHWDRRPDAEEREAIRANVLEARGWTVLHFPFVVGAPSEIRRIRRIVEPLIADYLAPELKLVA